MNLKHLTSLLAIFCTSLMLVHATRIERISNNVSFESKRIVCRDLRAPPIQHVYPRVGKSRHITAQYRPIQTTTTIPQLCDCTQIFEPVCGSNGKTFTNNCIFNCAAESDASLRIVSNGICATAVQHVEQTYNRPRPRPINPRQHSQWHTDCACPEIYNPFCASNEQTYPNVCAFTCEKRKHPSVRLHIVHRGECTPRRMTSTILPPVNTWRS